MTFGSVCSGIEAASAAWHPLGWSAAFFAEINPQPSAVLAHRFPGVPNLGDFTTIGAAAGPIDLLVGGTPCQSFSVAGLRGGMADARGNLALEFLRLADRLRPVWVVWENVPGVLSSNGGRDFGAFLGGLAELGYGFAYRVLDAQHFGVPQRRRRVFVVGHLGDWRRAVAVLFERDCLSGNPPPGREARPVLASALTRSLGSGGARAGRAQANHVVAGSLTGSMGRRNGQPDGGDTAGHLIARTVTSRNTRLDGDTETFIAHTLRGTGFDASEDGTGRGTPLAVVPIDMRQASRGGTMTNNRAEGSSGGAPGTGIGEAGDPSPSLSLSHPPAIAISFNPQAGGKQTSLGYDPEADTIGTLGCCQTPAVAFQDRFRGDDGRGYDRPPLVSEGQVGTLETVKPWNVVTSAAVRRLTPVECEKLQGFPPDWTLVPYKGKPMADGPRYQMIGNSMAVPVMAWIGRRITEATP